MRLPDPGHALAIGRVETKRRFRIVTGSKLQAGALAVAGAFLVLVSAGAGFAAFAVAPEVAAGEVENAAQYATWAASGLFLGTTALTGLRIVGEQGELDHEAGMLTTVPHEDGVGGILIAELVGAAAYVAVPVLAVSVALAAAGAVVLGATVLFAAALLVLLGALAGHAVGYALRYGFVRSAFLAKHKTKLAVGVFLAYMYFVTVQQDPSVFLPLLDAVGATPVGWVGLLPLAAVGLAPLSTALAGLVATAIAAPVLLRASVAAAGVAWYADEVSPGAETGTREETSVAAGPLEGVVGRPSAWVARTAWTRAYRAPIKLVFVLYPAFALVTPLVDVARTGDVPASLPVILALYGAWAAGAGFALNPLGDEGAMLPVTLTSGVAGHRFVRGLVVAAAVAGAPVVLPLALVAGVFVPFDPLQLGSLAVATVALLVGAGMLATGVGCAFPRFESVRISRSRRVVAPSLVAFAVYSLVLVVVATPGLVTQVPGVADALADQLGLPVATLRAGGAVLTAVLVGVCGYVSYRSAARAVDGHTL